MINSHKIGLFYIKFFREKEKNGVLMVLGSNRLTVMGKNDKISREKLLSLNNVWLYTKGQIFSINQKQNPKMFHKQDYFSKTGTKVLLQNIWEQNKKP